CVIFGMIIASTVMIDSAVMLKFSLLTGLIGGIVSEIGDLFASSIKRVLNVKDYSRLIPGHGGVLDRFDSTLMAAPVVLILLDLFLMI
ncbi:MAG: phosphatidate cytidylyltransferase, partial [Firmicutes bacterium]|nr:phosphatidate cytidylyltransferase [Bacillota bacterium]